MQSSHLAAFAPLFASGGKHLYSRASVHFLSEITRYPQLRQLLQHVGSVNLTREGHYFAFDEALEVFGVKYIKQSMTQRIITEDNFKRHIKSAQSERAITDLLFSELSDENVNPGEHAVKSRYEAVRQLAQKMFAAFIDSNDNDGLFENCQGLTKDGYIHMFNVYSDGEHRLAKLYYQEIICKETVSTTGAAIIAVPKTSASDVTYVRQSDRATTPQGQMIPDVELSDPPTPRSHANKRMSTSSPLTEELEPIVIAAIRHYKLCEFCGCKYHKKVACPYRDKLPSASWLNKFVIRAHNLNTSKRPKLLERMAATIEDELQLRREEIRQLQAQNPEVAITLIKCSRCLRDGHRAFECTDNNN